MKISYYNKNRILLKQLTAYGSIGMVCLGLDLSLFALLLRFEVPIELSNTLSISLALFVSFHLNSRFTFKAGDLKIENFLKYIFFGIFTILISNLLIHLLVAKLELEKSTSKLIVLLPTSIIQFSLNRIFNYR